MTGRRTAAKVFLAVAITTVVVAAVGFLVSLLLNIFAFDDYDAYGEVPIPGEQELHLPAGEVDVNFATIVLGGGNGSFYTPRLGISVTAPDGVDQDAVVVADSNLSSSTTVNNDARAQVFTLRLPAEGDYLISTDGEVSGFIEPRLTFGHGSPYWWIVWVFAGLVAFGILDLVIAIVWLMRARRTFTVLPSHQVGTIYPYAAPPASYVPAADGILGEQLRTIAALRDSGAMTEDEYQAEQRRLLDGY